MKDRLGIWHLFGAFGNSVNGLRDAFRLGCAFRQEVVLGVIHFALLFVIDESLEFRLLMAALWVLLLVTELVNSAVEAVVDFVSSEWNELARLAKDFCSASVFIVSLSLVGMWLLVLLRLWKRM